MIQKLQNLPVGTLLICTKLDMSDDGHDISEGDISLIVRQTRSDAPHRAITVFLSLTQGVVYNCEYGRSSQYAMMSCYEVYDERVTSS